MKFQINNAQAQTQSNPFGQFIQIPGESGKNRVCGKLLAHRVPSEADHENILGRFLAHSVSQAPLQPWRIQMSRDRDDKFACVNIIIKRFWFAARSEDQRRKPLFFSSWSRDVKELLQCFYISLHFNQFIHFYVPMQVEWIK